MSTPTAAPTTTRRGIDPEEIYGLDGDKWLRVSDLRALVALVQP